MSTRSARRHLRRAQNDTGNNVNAQQLENLSRNRRSQRRNQFFSREEEEEEEGNFIQENTDTVCQRCFATGANVECLGEGCTKWYHEETCSDLRMAELKPGRRGDYHCFECIFKYIYSKEPSFLDIEDQPRGEDIYRQWLEVDNYKEDINIPQIGDCYFFIPDAYEKFISQCFRILNYEPGETIWPQEKIPTMRFNKKSQQVKVLNISYELPNLDCKNAIKKYRNFLTIFAKIELGIIDESRPDTNESFIVRYFPSDDNFLIHSNYYIQKVEECLKLKKNVKFTFEQFHYLSVEDFNPATYDDYYHVIKGKDLQMQGVGVTTRNQERQEENVDKIDYFSPWEIVVNRSSDNKFEYTIDMSNKCEEMNHKEQERIAEIIERSSRRSKFFFTIFYHPVNLETFTDYQDLICYQMSVSRIVNRLSKTHYYRSQEQIEYDLDLIRENSAIYNGSENQITQVASLFVEHIKLLLAGDEETAEALFKELQETAGCYTPAPVNDQDAKVVEMVGDSTFKITSRRRQQQQQRSSRREQQRLRATVTSYSQSEEMEEAMQPTKKKMDRNQRALQRRRTGERNQNNNFIVNDEMSSEDQDEEEEEEAAQKNTGTKRRQTIDSESEEEDEERQFKSNTSNKRYNTRRSRSNNIKYE